MMMFIMIILMNIQYVHEDVDIDQYDKENNNDDDDDITMKKMLINDDELDVFLYGDDIMMIINGNRQFALQCHSLLRPEFFA